MLTTDFLGAEDGVLDQVFTTKAVMNQLNKIVEQRIYKSKPFKERSDSEPLNVNP